jgi:hypothetical protein
MQVEFLRQKPNGLRARGPRAVGSEAGMSDDAPENLVYFTN